MITNKKEGGSCYGGRGLVIEQGCLWIIVIHPSQTGSSRILMSRDLSVIVTSFWLKNNTIKLSLYQLFKILTMPSWSLLPRTELGHSFIIIKGFLDYTQAPRAPDLMWERRNHRGIAT